VVNTKGHKTYGLKKLFAYTTLNKEGDEIVIT
jgi:hypothetical protein